MSIPQIEVTSTAKGNQSLKSIRRNENIVTVAGLLVQLLYCPSKQGYLRVHPSHLLNFFSSEAESTGFNATHKDTGSVSGSE